MIICFRLPVRAVVLHRRCTAGALSGTTGGSRKRRAKAYCRHLTTGECHRRACEAHRAWNGDGVAFWSEEDDVESGEEEPQPNDGGVQGKRKTFNDGLHLTLGVEEEESEEKPRRLDAEHTKEEQARFVEAHR